MSVETSNAPREVWVTLTARGEPIQVWTTAEEAWHQTFAHRGEPYLRRDLVVPTVDELRDAVVAVFRGPDVWLVEASEAERAGIAARAVHRLLLSRIEGDDEPPATGVRSAYGDAPESNQHVIGGDPHASRGVLAPDLPEAIGGAVELGQHGGHDGSVPPASGGESA